VLGQHLLWLPTLNTTDSGIFLGGYEDRSITIPSTNEHRFVLDCIEERSEALSGSGNGNRFHIFI
jgi:hypothetical protein